MVDSNRSGSVGPGIRLLVVEDNPADAELVQIALEEEAPGEFIVSHVGSLAAAMAHLRAVDVDVVLLDLGLPDCEGVEGVGMLRQVCPDVPIIVLTGLVDKAMGLAAIERGAQSLAVKGWEATDALLDRIRSAIGRRKALGELAAVSSSLRTATRRLQKLGPDPKPRKP